MPDTNVEEETGSNSHVKETQSSGHHGRVEFAPSKTSVLGICPLVPPMIIVTRHSVTAAGFSMGHSYNRELFLNGIRVKPSSPVVLKILIYFFKNPFLLI